MMENNINFVQNFDFKTYLEYIRKEANLNENYQKEIKELDNLFLDINDKLLCERNFPSKKEYIKYLFEQDIFWERFREIFKYEITHMMLLYVFTSIEGARK